jgi:arsenate reductase
MPYLYRAVRYVENKPVSLKYREATMNKKKVLFVCIHNSARSQMAEAFLNQLGGDKFEAESAGLEPGELNPLVVKAMQEVGIDISGNKTKSVFDFYRQGRSYDYVITVCDESQSEQCPVFPGTAKKLHWGFSDPSSFHGTGQEKLKKVKKVRDEIKTILEKWLEKQNPKTQTL